MGGRPDVKAIFSAALEQPAGHDRAAYLTNACAGDDATRRRVEELLEALERASEVLGPSERPSSDTPAGFDIPTSSFEPAWAAGPKVTADETSSASAADALPPGTAVRYFGDYEILRELGHGGMGVVYEARQVSLNRPVALKMIRAGLLAGDHELLRFRNEAEAVALLDHPGIVPVYEVGEHEGQHFFSMKLVPGGSLVPLLPRYRDDPRGAARLVVQAAKAVAHAHMRGILHRDLKPANLLVDAEGYPHVTDFGLARRIEADTELTASGMVLGTPAYMAPEQAAGRRGSITTATDVYGLGTVLYALLTGQAPFGGASVVETLEAVRNASPESPRQLNAVVPRDLEVICLKCLEKDPRRRYPTAAALAEDLGRYLEGRPITARPVGAATRMWMWSRRNPRLAGLAASLVLALLAGTITSTAFALRARAEARRANIEAARANGEKTRAQQQRDNAERLFYAAEIQLASRDYAAYDLAQMRYHLSSLVPSGPDAVDHRGFEWSYLQAACQQEIRVFRGHEGPLKSLTFAPDGRRLATSGYDGTVRLRDTATGRDLAVLRGHERLVSSLAFAPDGRRLATSGNDGTVRLWDAETGEELTVLLGHEGIVNSLAFAADGRRLATSGYDGTVRLWNAETGREQAILLGHEGPVGNIAFVLDGRRLATSGNDGTVRLWDAETGEELAVLLGHQGLVTCLAVAPDGRRLASASNDGTIRLWDAESGVEFPSLRYNGNLVTSLSFAPDGLRLATVSRDGKDWTMVPACTVRIWDSWSGRELLNLRVHEGIVYSLAFAPDGRRLATSGYDGTVRLWDAETGREQAVLRGHEGGVTSVVFSPDGRRLASAGGDGTARLWDAVAPDALTVLRGPGDRLHSVAIAPDGQRLAMAVNDNTTRLWDLETGVELAVLRHEDTAWPVAFSPDGRRVATASFDGTARLWDAESGRELRVLRGHEGKVGAVAFAPDGDRLVTGGDDGTLRLWEISTGRQLAIFDAPKALIYCIAFRRDGRRLATAASDGTARLWDANTGRQLAVFRGHGGRSVDSVDFAPDNRRVASSGADGTVRIWDAETGHELVVLRGHRRTFVNWVAFSPDGRRVATASFDGTARLWDAETGRELFVFHGHEGGVVHVRFSADGTRLATAGHDGTVRIWDASLVTEEVRERRDALSVVRFLIDQAASEDELRDLISRESTISESVRARALGEAGRFWETRVRSRSEAVVGALFEAGCLRAEVRESLGNDPSLAPEVKAEALSRAEVWNYSPKVLITSSRQVACHPDRDRSAYLGAFRRAEIACRLEPGDGKTLNTLGIAQFRCGLDHEALETLQRSNVLNGGDKPMDLAFLAMANYRLGHRDRARALLTQLRDVIRDQSEPATNENLNFLREAESLILGDPRLPGLHDLFAPGPPARTP
ncbi:WD40 domain-containing protein [Tautonia marina]|uniref:WD40 domain-containing protein n=1 Tax=Tautonia marina TaxID=2653855 RepID=UPI0012612CEF|nr:protein kinase [Tautonia marina]